MPRFVQQTPDHKAGLSLTLLKVTTKRKNQTKPFRYMDVIWLLTTSSDKEIIIIWERKLKFFPEEQANLGLLQGRCAILSRVRLFVTPWTVACQARLSMEFSRQEDWSWSVLPFPSSGDLPDPGIEPRSPKCRRIPYHLSHQGGWGAVFLYQFAWSTVVYTALRGLPPGFPIWKGYFHVRKRKANLS